MKKYIIKTTHIDNHKVINRFVYGGNDDSLFPEIMEFDNYLEACVNLQCRQLMSKDGYKMELIELDDDNSYMEMHLPGTPLLRFTPKRYLIEFKLFDEWNEINSFDELDDTINAEICHLRDAIEDELSKWNQKIKEKYKLDEIKIIPEFIIKNDRKIEW